MKTMARLVVPIRFITSRLAGAVAQGRTFLGRQTFKGGVLGGAPSVVIPGGAVADAALPTTDAGKPFPAPNSIPSPKEGVGRASNFNPVKASKLLATPCEPLTWVWEPYLPVGSLALLAAYMKVGKSTFTYALAVAVAQGQPFLGYPTKQGCVLILAVEEHSRDVRLRLERFGLSQDDPLYVHAGRLSWADMADIRSFVKDQPVNLLILDTLSRFWDIRDENDNAEVTRRVSPFLDLARETNAAVLLIHHERKSGGEDGRGIRGGSALFGLVDQALLLDKRQRGDASQRALKTVGRYEESPSELVFELEGNRYRSLGTQDHLDFEERKTKVYRVLTDVPRTPEAIAADARLSEKMTNRVLEALCAESPGARASRQGRGVKGDPYLYRCPAMDSIPSQPLPMGEETNSAEPTVQSPDKGNSIQVSTEERDSRPSVEAKGPAAALKEAGVEAPHLSEYTWHGNRHTFASRLAMAGVDPLTIKEVGGWRTLAMVQRYAHLAPGHLHAAVERLVSQQEGAVELARN